MSVLVPIGDFPAQVPLAQVIRRFRDLDMPLDQVRAVVRAPDVETRTKEIIAHLTSMETKLAELQMSVASLRALLEGPAVRPEVEFRSIPPTRAGRPEHRECRWRSRSPPTSGARPAAAGCRCSARGCSRPGRCGRG